MLRCSILTQANKSRGRHFSLQLRLLFLSCHTIAAPHACGSSPHHQSAATQSQMARQLVTRQVPRSCKLLLPVSHTQESQPTVPGPLPCSRRLLQLRLIRHVKLQNHEGGREGTASPKKLQKLPQAFAVQTPRSRVLAAAARSHAHGTFSSCVYANAPTGS